MNIRPLLLASIAASPVGACATVPVAPPAIAAEAPPAPAQTEHERLFALFAADDEATLKLSPIGAIYRGDLRYAAHLDDMLTPELDAAYKKLAEDDLATLRTIDRSRLDATDRIAYDVFEYQNTEALKGLTPERLALTEVRPLNHFDGLHTFYPTFSSGEGGAPYKTLTDYENGLSRNGDYARIIDRAIAKFREGEASGVLETSLTIRNVIDQLDTQLALPVEKSPYWGPIEHMPADFPAADKARLTEAYRASITNDIYAANTRLRDFLKTEYLPRRAPVSGSAK